LAAAVCARLFADVGADVSCVDPDISTPFAAYLNHGKSLLANDTAARHSAIAAADLIVCEGRPQQLCALQYDAESLRRLNANAVLVYISPFGQTGPKANDPATDLTLHFASGIARLLTGQVDDLAEPPIRPVGEQSAFLGGIAAACVGMHEPGSPERPACGGGRRTAMAPRSLFCPPATGMSRSRRAKRVSGRRGSR
jgi:benzylsuccinate CoA-transferase BbsE subunit